MKSLPCWLKNAPSEFIFKISDKCNLACKYCYIFQRSSSEWRNQAKCVSQETVRSFAIKLSRYIEEYSLKCATIGFHGGEPLLIGKDYFIEIVNIIKKQCGNKVHFSLQTNATLIDDEWVSIFSGLDILVGISLDGPKKTTDLNRLYPSGKSAYDDIVRGLKLILSAYSAGKVRFGGVLSVIDPKTDAGVYYHHFRHSLMVEVFEPLLPDTDHDTFTQHWNFPTSDEYSQFLCNLFDIWLEDFENRSTIPLFSDLVGRITGSSVRTESLGAETAPSITIDTDGYIQPHDVLRINANNYKSFINVMDNSIDDIFKDDLYAEVNNIQDNQNTRCNTCPVGHICKGGFIGHRFSSNRRYKSHSIYCSTLYSLVTHAYLRISSGVNIEEEC